MKYFVVTAIFLCGTLNSTGQAAHASSLLVYCADQYNLKFADTINSGLKPEMTPMEFWPHCLEGLKRAIHLMQKSSSQELALLGKEFPNFLKNSNAAAKSRTKTAERQDGSAIN